MSRLLDNMLLTKVNQSNKTFAPHQYILNLKVEKMRNLIEKGYSISNAAIQSGFNDQSYFNRNIK